jgi:hypothetical protein
MQNYTNYIPTQQSGFTSNSQPSQFKTQNSHLSHLSQNTQNSQNVTSPGAINQSDADRQKVDVDKTLEKI